MIIAELTPALPEAVVVVLGLLAYFGLGFVAYVVCLVVTKNSGEKKYKRQEQAFMLALGYPILLPFWALVSVAFALGRFADRIVESTD